MKLVGETAGPGAAERAVTLFSDIAAGNWHQARADFTDRMKSALDEEELAAAWAHVTAEAGAYQGAGEPAAAQADGLTNVCVPLRFDACVMEGCAAFDAQGKVAGLHFLLNTDGHGDNAEPGDMILRCSDGHLFVASRDTLLWRSIHFGTKQFRPCPVDHRWRFAVFVNPRELTDAERQQAESNRI